MKRLVFVFVSVGAMSALAAPFLPTAPKGYKVSTLGRAKNARQMALSTNGNLYVGSMEAGVLTVIAQGKSRELLQNLNYPTGILWHKGDLYLAEISKLSVIRGIDELVKANKPLTPVVLKSDFPQDLNHGWKTIALGPDGKLYIPVGAPCNVCIPKDPYGALHRLDVDGKNLVTLARGIRNTVGLTFHPTTAELWFTEMGRDNMGDNVPPEEINILKTGAHYGFPYEHASKVKDPYYFSQKPKDLVTTPPVGEMQAHTAPIGLLFTHGSQLAKDYPGCLLVAQHGSWNHSKKVGYEVVIGCPDKQNRIAQWKPFLTGFLKRPSVFGRPVDLRFDAQGALLVSDDHAGTVWRVEKTK
jgi:glucose/arabinose dehydrogenase